MMEKLREAEAKVAELQGLADAKKKTEMRVRLAAILALFDD